MLLVLLTSCAHHRTMDFLIKSRAKRQRDIARELAKQALRGRGESDTPESIARVADTITPGLFVNGNADDTQLTTLAMRAIYERAAATSRRK